MRRVIIASIVLMFAPYAYGATKVMNSSGVSKINAWAQKVARIYGTALKNLQGTVKAEDLDVYVYAYTASGFTVSGYSRTSYSNSNMTTVTGCFANMTPQGASGGSNCPGSFAQNLVGKDYGPFTYNAPRWVIFNPADDVNHNQSCISQNYGFGSCNGANGTSSIRPSCVTAIRQYVYDMAPVAYCNLPNGAKGWSATYYNTQSDDVCLSASSLKASFAQAPVGTCATNSKLAEIKQVLQAYKSRVTSCSTGLLPDSYNADLKELDEVLGVIGSGYRLEETDVQGDVNPSPAINPWTYTNPTLAIEGKSTQSQVVANPVPENFKVKVSNADGTLVNTSIGFSIIPTPPAPNWSFVPGETGQPVTRATVNGIAATGFQLGTTPGSYQIKATCSECCPGEVMFTAQAVSENQATELRPYPAGNCDFNSFVGRQLRNGIRVRAVNKFTGKGVPNRQVGFTLVSHPGGTGMSLTPASPNTVGTGNPNGVARAQLTLGSLAGNHRISAVCQSCEGNQQVICNINALPLPEVCSETPEVAPIPLKKSPINVTLQDYIVEPGGTTHVYVRGQVGLGLVASVEPVPNTGGHQHTNPVRPHGTISPSMLPLDTNGYAEFAYMAGEVGGQERIIISAPELPDYGDVAVLVSVPGLGRLGPSTDYLLSGERPTHPSNHYGAQVLLREVQDLASVYADTYEALIYVNDMSLINGGIFDHRNTWAAPHALHKNGASVDFDRYQFSRVLRGRVRARNIATNIDALAENPANNINCRRINEDNLQTPEDLRQNGSLAHFECPR